MIRSAGLFDGCGGALGKATISDDGRYRYTLERRWADVGRYVLWVMLNPSTADAAINDATVRRCIGYAKGWGYTGILVGNLYAYRATNPRDMLNAAAAGVDIVGRENDRHLDALLARASLVVCAWGKPGPLNNRRWDVMRKVQDSRHAAHVLRFNVPKHNLQVEPSHPLRLPATLEPKVWEMFEDHGPGAGG